MKRYFKYFGYLFFLPFWWLQLLVPRKKNIWVFGAWYGKKYGDNPKYLFEYIIKDNNKIRAIWLTKSKQILLKLRKLGFECYLSNSWKGILFSLLAKKVVFGSGKVDVNKFFINGSQTIQTWHGSPMKKIGLDDKYSWSPYKKLILKYIFPFVYEFNIDYVISTAAIFNKYLASAFDISEKKVLLTGYPRNDVFSNQTDIHPLIESMRKSFNNPKIIIYLPTFRSTSERVDLFSDYGFEPKIFNDFLEDNNYIFINKGHYIDDELGLSDEFQRIINLKDSDFDDINCILSHVDLLITDYSGVYFDFLLTQKPIIFTPFDYNQYISNHRELYFSYSSITAGAIAKTWKDVEVEITQTFVYDAYIKQRNEMNSLFNKYLDGSSSKRLFNRLEKLSYK